MKKCTLAILVALLLLILAACKSSSYAIRNEEEYDGGFNGGFDSGFDSGYNTGYSDGYHEGIIDAQSRLTDYVIDDLYDLSHEIEAEWGISPEDAMKLLSNYADVPDEVDADDVPNAIWAIYSYYHDSREIINSMDSYDVE